MNVQSILKDETTHPEDRLLEVCVKLGLVRDGSYMTTANGIVNEYILCSSISTITVLLYKLNAIFDIEIIKLDADAHSIWRNGRIIFRASNNDARELVSRWSNNWTLTNIL